MKGFKHIKTKENFIARARTIHGDKYDYSKVEFPKRELLTSFNGKKTRKPPEYFRAAKVIIICPTHGEFVQTARKHIELSYQGSSGSTSGSGCPRCASECNSKVRYDERGIANFIDSNAHEIHKEHVIMKCTPSDGIKREVLINKEDTEILEYGNWYVTGHQKSRRSRTLYCTGTHSVRIKQEGLEWLGAHPKLHRLIMSRILGRPLQKKEYIDHINGNGLDNRRDNLRIATQSQNIANSKKARGKYSSKYKGVYHDRTRDLWGAAIGSCNGGPTKREYLGRWPKTPQNEILAAKAYDKRAKEIWGEFASLNFPDNVGEE